MIHKTLSQKKPSQKRAAGVAQGVGAKFKPQCHIKEKKNHVYTINVAYIH
jgi:hypothetical protein